MALNPFFRCSWAVWAGVLLTGLVPTPAVHAQQGPSAQPVVAACTPFKGRKLSLVIPFKPGGGYDLMGRALEPFLAAHSGMSVVISNVTAGNGVQAIQAVTQATSNRPIMGLINFAAFTTQVADGRVAVDFSRLQGVGIMSIDSYVWLSREPVDWFKPPTQMLLGAASSSPYARLSMPGELLGANIKPLFGYEGSNDGWMALLRNEVDLMPSSDASAKRYLATGDKATVSLVLMSQPHPDFPRVPHLAGKGGVLDVQSRKLPPQARQRVMELGELAVMLSESTRALVVSRKLGAEMRHCLQAATHAALFDPELSRVARTQKFALNPLDAQATDAKMRLLQATLNKHSDYLQTVASGVKAER